MQVKFYDAQQGPNSGKGALPKHAPRHTALKFQKENIKKSIIFLYIIENFTLIFCMMYENICLLPVAP